MGESKGYIKKVDEKGTVSISEEVVAVIAASATVDVEGVHGLYVSHGKEITTVNGRKGIFKGVRLNVDNDKLKIDVYIVAKIGYPVNELGVEVQNAIISAVEDAAGIVISEINVHICGVALKKTKPSQPPAAK